MGISSSYMASLRQFPASKFWYACFTMPNGQRVQRTTRETDRKKAQRLPGMMPERRSKGPRASVDALRPARAMEAMRPILAGGELLVDHFIVCHELGQHQAVCG